MASIIQTPDFYSLQPSFDLAIAKDIGDGDHSAMSSLDPLEREEACLLAKDTGIIACLLYTSDAADE